MGDSDTANAAASVRSKQRIPAWTYAIGEIVIGEDLLEELGWECVFTTGKPAWRARPALTRSKTRQSHPSGSVAPE
jgi:hypothetical protein